MREQREIEEAEGILNGSLFEVKRGDTFHYGMLMGKLVALGWVLGEPSADMFVRHDFDSWMARLQDIREETGLTEET